jgi:hypothetical protein
MKGNEMSHVVIDTKSKLGVKRRQIKSKGHNGLNVEKIFESRAKAVKKSKSKK